MILDCIICGQDHRPTSLICGDCYRLSDRNLRIRESRWRRAFLRSRCMWSYLPLEVREEMLSHPEYLPIAREVYTQAKARIEGSLTEGYIHDRLRRDHSLANH